MPTGKPYTVLCDLKNKEPWPVDIAHPVNDNLNKPERDKIRKYTPLSTEYTQIHRLKYVEVIALIITVNVL